MAESATWASQAFDRFGNVAESTMSAGRIRGGVGHVADSETWSARRTCGGQVGYVGESDTWSASRTRGRVGHVGELET